MQRSPVLRAFALLIFALVYFVAGKLGLKLAFVHQSATAVWPPTGIALAALLLFGRQMWPGVLVGAFLVNLTTEGSILPSLGIATGNTLEAVIAAHLVNRYARGRDAFFRHQDVFKFAFFAGVCSTAVSATIGVISLCVAGSANWRAFPQIWSTWWLGDAVGDFVVAPVLVLWAKWPKARVNWIGVTHGILIGGGLIALSMLVFGGWNPWRRNDYPLEFLCMPVLLLAAFRFGPRAAAATSLFLAGIALWGTLHGYGPFVMGPPNESLLLLQSYMGVSTVMALAVAAVVWDREQVRRQLASQARELERSNADLQQFAYVASHDLQEPLRTVGIFVDLLQQRYGGALDRDANQYMRYITAGARRMAALVDGILLYSRVSSDDGAAAQADSSVALQAALANLSSAIQESDAVIVHDALPAIRVNEAQLTLVFQNLIANAIKYRSAEPPQIRISAVQKDDVWEFAVSDNGVGIQPAYRQQVFVLFKRLHSADVSGAGIGLAVCKKIVERYGGRIWVDEPDGPGARICFTIPCA